MTDNKLKGIITCVHHLHRMCLSWTLFQYTHYTSFHFKSKQSQGYKHEHVAPISACTARACMVGREAESQELVLVASAMLKMNVVLLVGGFYI